MMKKERGKDKGRKKKERSHKKKKWTHSRGKKGNIWEGSLHQRATGSEVARDQSGAITSSQG